ncbi:MAG: putative transrane anti-sigma factor [Deltaproteobacteria bacterium]|nr:putative transrane anti-sigma factor [Deltaproteobacteria bacterium]
MSHRNEPIFRDSRQNLCQSIDTLAMAFLDDELVAEERRELELHLLGCASCCAHVDRERADLELVRKALVAPPAPDFVKARLALALDAEDHASLKADRQRSLSSVGRWILPGAAMAAAAAAIVAFVAVRPPVPTESGAVAKEVVRQQTRSLPLEVQGAGTGPWLRENFAPIEPPQFRTPSLDIQLLGARLTAVSGHNAAQLRYVVTSGANRFTLTAVVIDDLHNDELTGGTAIKFGDRVLHVHDANGIPAVTYVDEHFMGYAFASERLTAQELLELVVSSDLIGRAQQGR